MDQGRRPELVGGGLIRSLGGWSQVRKLRLMGHDCMKADERISSDGDFGMEVLSEANERIDSQYVLKNLVYTIDKLEDRLLRIYGINKEELYAKGSQKVLGDARSVFCYWAVRELGVARVL